jgi:hypothetical protein
MGTVGKSGKKRKNHHSCMSNMNWAKGDTAKCNIIGTVCGKDVNENRSCNF